MTANDNKELWKIIGVLGAICLSLISWWALDTRADINKNAVDIDLLNKKVTSRLVRIDSILTVKTLIDSLQTEQMFQKLEDIEGKLP